MLVPAESLCCLVESPPHACSGTCEFVLFRNPSPPPWQTISLAFLNVRNMLVPARLRFYFFQSILFLQYLLNFLLARPLVPKVWMSARFLFLNLEFNLTSNPLLALLTWISSTLADLRCISSESSPHGRSYTSDFLISQIRFFSSEQAQIPPWQIFGAEGLNFGHILVLALLVNFNYQSVLSPKPLDYFNFQSVFTLKYLN